MFSEVYRADMARYSNIEGYLKKFHYFFRKIQTTNNKLMKFYCKYQLKKIRNKYGIEIAYATQIGKGLYLGHAWNITINGNSVIGENCNIHKGVVIGQENRGKRKGTPVIGDCVWVGINAAIVGNVRVGSDVLIAPNTYVNCDIPDHSVVFGNPCIIKHKDNATEEYINRIQ